METSITTCKAGSQPEFAVCLRDPAGALYQPGGVGWEGGGRLNREGTCVGLWLTQVEV